MIGLGRKTILLAALLVYPSLANAIPILGSSLLNQIPPEIQEATLLEKWYHSQGYVWVRVIAHENQLIVQEYPLRQIKILPPEESSTVQKYLKLKLDAPLNKIVLEEQLQFFYRSSEFQERYYKLTLQPDIYPTGMVLTIQIELKAYSELILLSQNARQAGLYAESQLNYQNQNIRGKAELAAILDQQELTFYSGQLSLKIPSWYYFTEVKYFNERLFSIQNTTAQLGSYFSMNNIELYGGYRLDVQNNLPLIQQMTASLRFKETPWQPYKDQLELEVSYEPKENLWRFYALAEGHLTWQNKGLTAMVEWYNRQNIQQVLHYLPYPSHSEYVRQNFSLFLFPYLSFNWLRMGPCFTTRPQVAQFALAALLELYQDSWYLRWVTGSSQSKDLFLRFFIASKL